MSDSVGIIKKIMDNVEKVIIGKRETVELVMTSLICGGHVLIEDVPGVGKTALVSSMAKSINASFKRIQFTPDLLPSDVTGFSMYSPRTGKFEYREGSVMCQILLADEINRTMPKTQSSLLEAMEEGQVTVDGVTYPLPKPFFVLATQNPVEYIGTNPLPEAQMDRFFMKVRLGYPRPGDEVKILDANKENAPLETLAPVASVQDILDLQQSVKQVYVNRSISDYIVEIINKTRENRMIRLGASPRGSMNLFRASQGVAAMNGRDYVIPDDVKSVAVPVLAHRLCLGEEAKLKSVTAEELIVSAVRSTSAPIAV